MMFAMTMIERLLIKDDDFKNWNKLSVELYCDSLVGMCKSRNFDADFLSAMFDRFMMS